MEKRGQRAHASAGEGATNLAAEVAVGSAFALDRDFNVPSPWGNSAAISPDTTYSVKKKSSRVFPKDDNILSQAV